MEFEEMQKVWNEQKGENMYVINELALQNNISRKKNAASRRINKVEVALTLINSFCAVFLLVKAVDKGHPWGYIGFLIMALTVLYIQFTRHKRKKAETTFDRSMLGELDHAIANTQSLIHFSKMMIIGYLLPMSVFVFGNLVTSGASPMKWVLMTSAYCLAFILIFWERRSSHQPRKANLLSLRKTLAGE
jgi:hypothetical protein